MSLSYTMSCRSGKQTYNYDKERDVGLLEDLLKAMNNTDMIIDLEVILFISVFSLTIMFTNSFSLAVCCRVREKCM